MYKIIFKNYFYRRRDDNYFYVTENNLKMIINYIMLKVLVRNKIDELINIVFF